MVLIWLVILRISSISHDFRGLGFSRSFILPFSESLDERIRLLIYFSRIELDLKLIFLGVCRMEILLR